MCTDPGIDTQIEQRGKTCPGCASACLPRYITTLAVAFADMQSSTHRLCRTLSGLDVSGSCGRAHTKWPKVIPMRTATSYTIIQAMGELFARFGASDQILSDD